MFFCERQQNLSTCDIWPKHWCAVMSQLAGSCMEMEAIKVKIVENSREHCIVDNIMLKAKLDFCLKFCVEIDCENNVISGIAVHKQCRKLLAFDNSKIGTPCCPRENNVYIKQWKYSAGSVTFERHFSKTQIWKLVCLITVLRWGCGA